MTNEEAHKILEDFQNEITQNRHAYSKDFIEAHGIAILALEERIANKDAREVKHGHNLEDNSWFICSICGWEDWDTYTASGPYNYCPNCGAMMDGEDG